MTLAYVFHPETRELVGSEPLGTSPLGKPIRIPPNHSTKTVVEPPADEGGLKQVWHPDTETWTSEEDHRGDTVYLTADRTDDDDNVIAPAKSPIEITALGPLTDDVTVEEPGAFDVWDGAAWVEDAGAKKAATIQAIKARAAQIILAVADQTKQMNMNARANELNDIRFDRALTADEEAERLALKGAFAWVKAVRAHSNAMEAALNNGQTVDPETGAIDGGGSWPSA